MPNETIIRPRARIKLTPEQRAQVEAVTGREAAALEFTAEELEARAAPAQVSNPFPFTKN